MIAADHFGRRNGSSSEADIVSQIVSGAGLPPMVEHHLREAGRNYHLDELAERHLMEAHERAPTHAAVLIGLYRFYFYKGRLTEALEIARLCLKTAAIDIGASENWRAVTPEDADFNSYDAVLPRFFLFTLKAYGYLQMRLGAFDKGREAVAQLMALDPGDKVGARVLLDVLDRMGVEDVD